MVFYNVVLWQTMVDKVSAKIESVFSRLLEVGWLISFLFCIVYYGNNPEPDRRQRFKAFLDMKPRPEKRGSSRF